MSSPESHIIVTTASGAVETIPARTGFTVMELIRDAGVEELAALCGGSCSCATCHVLVSPEWMAVLPQPDPAETALLEESEGATPFSRLSCQLPFSAALAGLSVTVMPAE